MNILKKLFTAVLFTSASVSLVLAMPYENLTWDQFAKEVGYDRRLEEYIAVFVLDEPSARQRQRELHVEVQRLQSQVIMYCAYHKGQLSNSSYHRALHAREKLADLRINCVREFTPNMAVEAELANGRECADLYAELKAVRGAGPEEAQFVAGHFREFLALFEPDDDDTDFVDPSEEGIVPSGEQSQDSQVAAALSDEGTEVPEPAPQTAPLVAGESDEEVAAAPQTHDALVAAGTLACAAAGYAAARKFSVPPRRAGALAGVIGLVGAAYSAYERWQGRPKQD